MPCEELREQVLPSGGLMFGRMKRLAVHCQRAGKVSDI